jgi:hypothetical protein
VIDFNWSAPPDRIYFFGEWIDGFFEGFPVAAGAKGIHIRPLLRAGIVPPLPIFRIPIVYQPLTNGMI